ncbi:hypothetical protein HDU83_006349 [Entophlyctis luteolus]|nr:hypothetical protein HDU83_006349 [Entophlyctis luteolus]
MNEEIYASYLRSGVSIPEQQDVAAQFTARTGERNCITGQHFCDESNGDSNHCSVVQGCLTYGLLPKRLQKNFPMDTATAPRSDTRRVTVVSNANHSIRTVAVLRINGSEVDQLIAVAANKLRLKKPKLMFDACGQTVAAGFNFSNLKEDDRIYISRGEPFVGLAKVATVACGGDVWLMANAADVDKDALAQLERTAQLPGVVRAVGYPDLCPGLRFPIGASFVVRNRIYPELIGSDIGCGMSAFKILAPIPSLERAAARLRGLDCAYAQADRVLEAHSLRSHPAHDKTLGTIGGGNHFAELLAVDRIETAAAFATLGLDIDSVILLVHSGSRSLGKAVLEEALAQNASDESRGLSFEQGTPAFETYMQQHSHACDWARLNRDLIAARFCAMLFDRDELAPDIIEWTREHAAHKIIDIHHNNVENAVPVTGNANFTSDSAGVWIHRKGAAPSDRGIVPIPGSRGALTYLVQARGSQERNAYSLPHGAGRKWTRSKALSTVSEKYKKDMASLERSRFSSIVICEDRRLLAEEAPEAYKNIEDVVADISGVADVVAVLKPLLTYKFRRDERNSSKN